MMSLAVAEVLLRRIVALQDECESGFVVARAVKMVDVLVVGRRTASFVVSVAVRVDDGGEGLAGRRLSDVRLLQQLVSDCYGDAAAHGRWTYSI